MESLEQVACVGAAFIIIHKHYKNKMKDRSKSRWWVRQLLQSRKTYSSERYFHSQILINFFFCILIYNSNNCQW
jgi:formate/nitrite transporter FocA (FNT family)